MNLNGFLRLISFNYYELCLLLPVRTEFNFFFVRFYLCSRPLGAGLRTELVINIIKTGVTWFNGFSFKLKLHIE